MRVAVVAMVGAVLAGASTIACAQVTDPAATTVAAIVAVVPQGGTIKGSVNASGVPLPGVAVTATNTLTGKKYATSTDVDGAFQMAVPHNGRYVLKTELAGFASTTQEVMVNAASENGGLPMQTAQFKMDLASRVTPEAGTTVMATTVGARRSGLTPGGTIAGAVARVGRGTQSLTVADNLSADTSDATAGQSNNGTQLPSLATSAGDSSVSSDSIAVSGQQGQINGLASFIPRP